jgi:peptide deformylase
MKVVQHPNPVLSTPTIDYPDLADPALLKLFRRMDKLMVAQRGVGLAAPQAGLNWRLAVSTMILNERRLHPRKTLYLANPRVIETSEEHETAWEGCLSLGVDTVDRDHWAVERPAHVTVATHLIYPDGKVTEETLELEGMSARIAQHEIDHLDGVLICDKGRKRKSELMTR